MRQTFHKLLIVILAAAVAFFSCKREFEKPRWDAGVLAPLVKSKLTIRDIVKDTAKVKTETDNSITLINRQEIFNYTIDSLVTLDAPQYHKLVKLSSLKLDNQTITRRISLGEIANQLIAQGGESADIGNNIILAHNLGKIGFKVPIDPINDISAGPIDIDVNQFFKTADLLSGTLKVKLENGLPLEITNIQFSLKNKNLGDVIASPSLTNILPGEKDSSVVDLAGKVVEGNLLVSINDMDIAGSNGTPIKIDTANALIVELSISNISVHSATAIFPAQDVVNDTTDVSLVNLDDVLLTQAIIRQGTVRADVYSTAQDIVSFTYKIPGAIKDGQPFQFDAVVPAAPANGTSYKQFNQDFSDFDMNLRGIDGDTFNTFKNILVGRIDYTGEIRTLSLDDSLDITLTLIDAKPSYIKGYLGKDTVAVGPDDIDIDIFKNISATTLDFESVKMNVVFDNALGIPSQVKLQELTARNTSKGTSATLTGPVINNPQTINPGTENPFANTTTTIDVSTGSNATSLLNLLPDQIHYAGEFASNPGANPLPTDDGTEPLYQQFAKSNVDLKAYLEIEIPLSLIAQNLVLSDTVPFDTKSFNASGSAALKDGRFNLLVSNGFPYDAVITMYFLTANGAKLDSVVTSATPILAAPVDASGKVTAPQFTNVPFAFTEAQLHNILNHSTQILFKARFDTRPSAQHVKIYSDYTVEFKLVGDINVQVNSGQ